MTLPSPTEHKKQFGRRLRTARLAKGYATVRDASKHLELEENTVSSWERGERRPDIWHLILIKSTYNVTLDWLIAGDDSGLSLEMHRRITDISGP